MTAPAPPAYDPPPPRVGYLDYPIPVSGGKVVLVRLPAEFTMADAERVAAVLRTLVAEVTNG